jgi:hypothetical protein
MTSTLGSGVIPALRKWFQDRACSAQVELKGRRRDLLAVSRSTASKATEDGLPTSRGGIPHFFQLQSFFWT